MIGFILNLLDIHRPVPDDFECQRWFEHAGRDTEAGLKFKKDGSIDMVCFAPDVFDYSAMNSVLGCILPEAEGIENLQITDALAVYVCKEDGWYRGENNPQKLDKPKHDFVSMLITEYFADQADKLKCEYRGE